MPKLTVNGRTIEVESGLRLVLAIERCGVPIGHRCGGEAHCTTCRVKFEAGEPDTMTLAEFNRLSEAGLLGEARLACQILCNEDMRVVPLVTAEDQPEWDGDTGPSPDSKVQPIAEWFPIRDLKDNA